MSGVLIDCQLCGESVPRETTTWQDNAGFWTTHICCSCLIFYRTAIPNDPHAADNYFAQYATEDDGWRDLMDSGEIPCLAVPINAERIGMYDLITFIPQGAA